MKKISVLFMAIAVMAMIFVLCGCAKDPSVSEANSVLTESEPTITAAIYETGSENKVISGSTSASPKKDTTDEIKIPETTSEAFLESTATIKETSSESETSAASAMETTVSTSQPMTANTETSTTAVTVFSETEKITVPSAAEISTTAAVTSSAAQTAVSKSAALTSAPEPVTEAAVQTGETDSETPEKENAFESSFETVANIKIGWNLGNSLDSTGSWINKSDPKNFETAWGNPVTTKELIHFVKQCGFNAVRIPVTYTEKIDENGKIDEKWLARIKEVVDYVIDEDMYCIINVHHDTGASEEAWLRADPAMYEDMSKKYAYLWEQAADLFKDYGEHLLFESFNEILDSDFNWGGSGSKEYETVNRLNQLFVDTIRASGGNNPNRNIIVNSYGASTAQSQLGGFKLPSDSAENHLIAEMHCYDPWAFTSNGGDTSWDSADKNTLETIFERINSLVVKAQGVPVIIGEFAAQDAGNDDDRAAYAWDFVRIAKKYNISCFWWDDGGSMKIIDRTEYKVIYPGIVESMMSALKED